MMQGNNRKQFALTTVSKACLLAISVSSMPLLAAEDAKAGKKAEEEVEVITVSGIRGSLQQSMNDKRFSSEVMDSISAEDIGQLPDENIAEALQRVTGIQMSRDSEGEGTTIQIRGVSDNNVEINGQTSSGTGSDRSVNFQDLPSELFSGIEVLKATTADRIEGALGGTINLKTRRPLGIQKDHILSVTAKAKHSDLAEETAPDFSVFGAKNWRDTAIGDFGFLATVARKESFKRSEAFGGSDGDAWAEAPGNWWFVNGEQNGGPAGTHSSSSSTGLDNNNDGVIDANDGYYMYGGFRTYAKNVETMRDSLNATLQWQPNDEINLFVDATLTDGEETESGTQFNSAISNAGPTLNFAHNFSYLGTTGNGEQRYIHDAGMITGVNVRMGGGPSHKEKFSESAKFTVGGDIQITDDLNVSAEYSRSEGSSYTKQAQLNMGLDYNQDNNFSGKDWAGLVGFDLRGSDMGQYTFYDRPDAPFGPLDVADLSEISDPTSLNNSDLSYFQMQRNADDTEQDDSSFKIDATLDLDTEFFTSIKVGARKAERSFGKVSYINKSQKDTYKYNLKDADGNNIKDADGNNLIVLDEDGNELYTAVKIQDISVDPASNTESGTFAGTGLTRAELASKLQKDCFSTESVKLANFSGSVPQSWATTTCGSDYHTDLFNLADIRTVGANGLPIFETTGSRYDVTEKTLAMYLRADFYIDFIADMSIFGNIGGRYIETETISSGYQEVGGVISWITEKGDYDDFLPSLNLNLAINEEMILRFAAAKVMSRPGLSAISPSVKYNFSDEVGPGYTGFGLGGNPDLDPVRAINYDLSYEWYYSDSSMFSAAIFYKDIESTIANATEPKDVWITNSQGEEQKWQVFTKENLEGTELQGLELGLTHTFDSLPGLLTHTGFSANYTYTEEPGKVLDEEGDTIGRKGLSEDSANLVAFYDDKKLSVRLAYNWRSEFVKRQRVQLGWGSDTFLTEYEEARGQLDLSANYSFNKHFKVNFSAVNLNDSVSKRYLKYEELTNYLSEPGRRFNLGVVYRF